MKVFVVKTGLFIIPLNQKVVHKQMEALTTLNFNSAPLVVKWIKPEIHRATERNRQSVEIINNT